MVRASKEVSPALPKVLKAHPAKFSDPILDKFRELIPNDAKVLDPFAGVGRIHELHGLRGIQTFGIEIENEWAMAHERTEIGDALELPLGPASFDVIATSPTYGNRMADSHNAKDGSRRVSYTHTLGRKLSIGNSGVLHWGDEYRRFHSLAWQQARRVLRVNGLLLLNISNHIREGKVARVAEWHIDTLVRMRFELMELHTVETKRMRDGQNADARMPYEYVVVFRR